MDTVQLRAYRDTDLDELIDIVRIHLEDDVVRYIGPWARSDAMLRQDIPDARDSIHVLDDGGVIIGFVWVEAGDRYLGLEEIHVIDSARGQGWGRYLMEFVHQEARRLGCSGVRLTVFEERPELHFYQHLDYVIVGENRCRGQVQLQRNIDSDNHD